MPDQDDEGLLEFYGMGGTHSRGRLLVGLVRVLRDDLPHEPGAAVEGIGYTVLATSRDGVHWTRDREPFLPRNPVPGTWDRAMTWASAVQPVGDELFIYYGGYARGHKIAPGTERQIGLARMRRDRYVSRRAGSAAGVLRTPLLQLPACSMTINAAIRGEVRVCVLNAEGEPLAELGESRAIHGDALAHPVHWRGTLATAAGRPVCLEFGLREAELFGFDLVAAG